jgi:ribosomal protein L11 methylase PrmA
VHLQALEKQVTLSDATAYNIQFLGPQPIFIDHLSFRRYRDGEYWDAHGQFCQQFLNPLLLRSLCGIPHNAWYRGSQEGITVSELNRLLPLRKKWSWNVFSQVTLQARLQSASTEKPSSASAKKRPLPKTAFRGMLESLRNWVSRLQPADRGPTVWSDYAKSHSYSDDEVVAKKKLTAAFASAVKPAILWDLGCNTGDYSKVALEAGAKFAVGFDFDQGALELGYARALSEKLNFLPLFLDAANPTPDQGWAGKERLGLTARGPADGLLALAVVHHLAISRNIPLPRVVQWLTGLAPAGVIEFVPKNDAMVEQLLRLREDIFFDYDEQSFLTEVSRYGRIVRQETVSKSGRLLVWYQRD